MTKEEAIKAIKAWDFLDKDEKEALETLIPELQENVDEWIEKIRKDIISYLNNRQITSIAESSAAERWVAWIEKQSNIIEFYEDKLGRCACESFDNGYKAAMWQKSTIQSKFKVGDEISKKHNSDINKFGRFPITCIKGGKYWYNDHVICNISEQDDWELVEQKSEWSEEDERIRKELIKFVKTRGGFKQEYIAWLEKQGKPKWSEEDERIMNFCISRIKDELESLRNNKFAHQEILQDCKEGCWERIDWLKFLKKRMI